MKCNKYNFDNKFNMYKDPKHVSNYLRGWFEMSVPSRNNGTTRGYFQFAASLGETHINCQVYSTITRVKSPDESYKWNDFQ